MQSFMEWMRHWGVLAILVFVALISGACILVAAPSTDPPVPLVTKDLPGKMVAVTDPSKPGQIVGWYFDKDDELTAKIVDQRKEGHKDVYYVELTTKSKAGGSLKGIAELYYVTVAQKQYLIAVGSINLELTLPPPPPKEGKSQPIPVQRPGGQ
jgi:hypothetical protein